MSGVKQSKQAKMTSFFGMPATKIRKSNEEEAERTVCADTDHDLPSSMRDAPIKQVTGPTDHNDCTAITEIQLASATAVSQTTAILRNRL
jgi:hypothetical protein